MVFTRNQSKKSKHVPEKKRKRNNHEQLRNKRRKKIQSSIEIGDTVDLSDLLFTTKRNYLQIYSQKKRVKAKDLSGKVVVLLFMSLTDYFSSWRTVITNLLDIYARLQPTAAFEIVFVTVRDYINPQYFEGIGSTRRQCFLDKVSTMPWPAIPLSDLPSRKRLETIFAISGSVVERPRSVIIDPRGVVLQSHATPLFLKYGAAAYPFTRDRIEYLESQDNLALMHPPCIEKLLTSPQRDYLINNKGDQVPLRNLNNKVVGLYICPCIYYQKFTEELKVVYQELSKNMEDFEIVLIYAHGWFEDKFGRTDEHSFTEALQTMPWLALPFTDTDCSKKLQRIFQYPQELVGPKPDARLVIVGPQGKYIERLGANIFSHYGVLAYPFTTFSAVNLELERSKKVKLEMLWDQNSVFTQKNGSLVPFSQLVGKRIIVLCQQYLSCFDEVLMDLKARYIKLKGTDDEFEVIHIRAIHSLDRYAEVIPWLMHHPFDEDSYAGKFINLIFHGNYNGLLAFDRDGSVMRRTSSPKLGDNTVFPFFHDGDLKNEVLLEVKEITDFKIKIR